MSLLNSMRTSISGLNAQTRKLDTIADNIANSSTVGYKRAVAHFSSLVIDAKKNSYTSGGVEATVRYNVNTQGIIQATGYTTDLAIQGKGFFYVEDASGTPALTRAGSFVPDKNGDLRNQAGFYLMGFPTDSTGAGGSANTNINDLTRIDLSQFRLIANPSTVANFSANFPSTAAIVTGNLPSVNAADSEFTAKSSLVTFDNLGQKVVLDIYFSKTNAGEWESAVYNAADATNGGFPYSSGPMTVDTLQFDNTTGELSGISQLSVTIPNGQTVTIDLSDTTQLAADYQVLSAQADGNAPTTIERIEIAEDGLLSVVYQDGTRREIFQIPLASVPSPQNLRPMDGNVFAESTDSGLILLGAPNSSALGTLKSASLESSNVDLGTELTSMIETQRAYTANSKTFKTSSEMLEILMSLRN